MAWEVWQPSRAGRELQTGLSDETVCGGQGWRLPGPVSAPYDAQCLASHKCCELPDHGFILWGDEGRSFPGKHCQTQLWGSSSSDGLVPSSYSSQCPPRLPGVAEVSESPVMPVTTRNRISGLGWTAQVQALGAAPGVGLEPDPGVTSLPQAASLRGQDWDPPPILLGPLREPQGALTHELQ